MNIAEHDAATAGYRVLHSDIQRPQNWFLLTTGTGGGCHSPDILKAVDWCFPVYGTRLYGALLVDQVVERVSCVTKAGTTSHPIWYNTRL